jgi:hypothetical protein
MIKKFDEFIINEQKEIMDSIYTIDENELKELIKEMSPKIHYPYPEMVTMIIGNSIDYLKKNCPKNDFKFIDIDKILDGEWDRFEKWDNFGIKDEEEKTLIFFTESFGDKNVRKKFLNYVLDNKNDKQKVVLCVKDIPDDVASVIWTRFIILKYKG